MQMVVRRQSVPRDTENLLSLVCRVWCISFLCHVTGTMWDKQEDVRMEHLFSLGATVGGLLPIHCRDCKCRPDFGSVTILGTQRDRVTREIIKAFHISCHEHPRVSEPSLALSAKNIFILGEKENESRSERVEM